MARTKTTEGHALWQPAGSEEDSRFREGNRHLRLANEEEEKDFPTMAHIEKSRAEHDTKHWWVAVSGP